MIHPTTPRAVVRFQNQLLRLLGGMTSGRGELVASMLRRDPSEATGYWLQVVVSVGIATLGLVIGSSAVVIGAMLIAPLVGPILGLAMGLASGSPFLVLRSSSRVVASVVVGVGGAALMTLLIPFHELNAEIASRTAPTVLDLLTACFCALAGVYAVLHPGMTAAATAAGTSIGVALVPPLCACGYGLGTRNMGVAGGAALLFLTNLVAIVAVGSVAFLAAGFNRVDVVKLETDELSREEEGDTFSRRLGARLSTLFASRWGPALRFLMPFVLFAGVAVPLERALDEVAWQVRVRQAVTDAIAAEPLRVVESRVRVERQSVDVLVVALADMEAAKASETRLDGEIRRISGIVPHIEVLAVPDAESFESLQAAMRTAAVAEAPVVVSPPAPPAPTAEQEIDAVRNRLRATLAPLWPTATAGRPLAVELSATDPRRLRVVHLGAALGSDAREAVRRAVVQSLGCEVELVDVAIPGTAIERGEDDLRFVARLSAGLRAAEGLDGLRVCVGRPPPPSRRRRRDEADLALVASVERLLDGRPGVAWSEEEAWAVRFVEGPCGPGSEPGAGDGGTERGAEAGASAAAAPVVGTLP